ELADLPAAPVRGRGCGARRGHRVGTEPPRGGALAVAGCRLGARARGRAGGASHPAGGPARAVAPRQARGAHAGDGRRGLEEEDRRAAAGLRARGPGARKRRRERRRRRDLAAIGVTPPHSGVMLRLSKYVSFAQLENPKRSCPLPESGAGSFISRASCPSISQRSSPPCFVTTMWYVRPRSTFRSARFPTTGRSRCQYSPFLIHSG